MISVLMAKPLDQVLSYATPAPRKRFGHMKADLPFTGGLAIGSVIACLMLAAAPRFVDSIQIFIVAIPFWAMLVAIYANLPLFLLGCFSPSTVVRSPVLICAIVGAGVPVLAAWVMLTVVMTERVLSPPNWLAEILLWAGLTVIGLLTLGSPFLLVPWRTRVGTDCDERRRMKSVLKMIAVGFVLLMLTLAIGMWFADAMFNRDCRQVAEWVRKTYPLAGSHLALRLPAAQRLLTGDETADAVTMPDGRVIVLLKTSLGWHGNWTGAVYSTGPIVPGEIGVDAYGRPQLRMQGLPYHFISRQIDPQHFEVAFDLG
jgi:hypothetical protein